MSETAILKISTGEIYVTRMGPNIYTSRFITQAELDEIIEILNNANELTDVQAINGCKLERT